MPRRRALAVVAVAALVFFLAGMAFGHYVLPRSKGDTAECIILRQDLTRLTYAGPGGGDERAQTVVDLYNEHCR
jgi:hypothetical protein